MIDPPGSGKSNGKSLPTRSDQVFNKPGLAALFEKVIKHFGLNKPLLAGYDYGAMAAMKMALHEPGKFSKVIAFHYSYTEDQKDELKKFKTPILIQ